MLTRLEIDGFKSFENTTIELFPLTVILGPNAAGKSNLFDAIHLLACLAAHDVASALGNLRGLPIDQFRRIGATHVNRIRLAAEVLVEPVVRDPWGTEVEVAHTRMRYEVELIWREVRHGVQKVFVAHERAVPVSRRDDHWARAVNASPEFRSTRLRYPLRRPWLTTSAGDQAPTFEIHQDGRQGNVRRRPAVAAEATVLSSITSSAEFPHLFALREELRHWRRLQLDPVRMGRPAPITTPDALEPDGGNLAAVLAHLKSETASEDRPAGVLGAIAADLNHLVPGIASVDATLDEASREYRVHLTLHDGTQMPASVVSDGTLRMLALLTMLHDPRHCGLVCLEEPENGIHPGRIRPLLEYLRHMVTQLHDDNAANDDGQQHLSQLLLNSHSPVVLSALLDAAETLPESLVLFADTASISDPVCKEVRRHTRLRPTRYAPNLPLWANDSGGFVTDLEVDRVLNTVGRET